MKPVNATRDFLTNCYAREALIPFLKKMEEEYLTNKRPFSVLIMDVDHFKSFNDKYGHMYGDEVLKYFSSSLRLDLEDEENMPFRFGGDEFVMVFPGKSGSDAYRLATRLRKNIQTRSCLIKGRQLSITFSGGIASYPLDANNVDDLIEKADKALYYSKNHGRGRILKYGDLTKKEVTQIAVVAAILVFVGAVVYFNREVLSEKAGRGLSALGEWVSQASAPAEAPAPPPAETPLPAPPPPAELPPAEEAPGPSQIYLESGRVVTGLILHESDETVEVEVTLNQGKGILQLKKSQIVRIKRLKGAA